MKKEIIFLVLILLVISGCSLNQSAGGIMTEKDAGEDIAKYDSEEVINRVNAIEDGLTPKLSKSSKSKSIKPIIDQEKQPEPQEIKLENLVSVYNQAIIKTNFGNITVAFYSEDSPITVNNFLNLAKKGFYNETKFHRVIKDFMIQGGDPFSKDDDWSDDGTGGPGYQFSDEINEHPLQRGSLAMANSGPDTNGSQFFIVTKDFTPWLDGQHTNFGYVVDGMDVVLKIEAVKTNESGHPIEDVIIKEIELITGE